MTRPTARVLAMLEILQSGGTRTVAELADRLAVDERTVRRYVSHLVDLGVPVESLRGRYGGIHLVQGYRMPPLMLTDDEALAVVVGLLASRGSGRPGAGGPAVESATSKLLRVLPRPLARRLDAVLSGVRFTEPQAAADAVQAAHLLTAAEAARDRRPLALDYTDSQGRRSTRTVHPYGVVAHSGRWYVTAADPGAAAPGAADPGAADPGAAAPGAADPGAADPGAAALRTFRVDRIAAATVLPGSFDVPEGFDAAATVLSSVAGAPRRHEVRLRVQAPAEVLRPLFPPGVAAVDGTDDGWTRVVIRAEKLTWVPAVLASIPAPFVVEGPDELRTLLRTLADRLAAAAAS